MFSGRSQYLASLQHVDSQGNYPCGPVKLAMFIKTPSDKSCIVLAMA